LSLIDILDLGSRAVALKKQKAPGQAGLSGRFQVRLANQAPRSRCSASARIASPSVSVRRSFT
jgi:hypothetical protein